MKKTIVVILLTLMMGSILNSQVLNTAKTMKPGRWGIGIDPIVESGPKFGVFLTGSVGLKNAWDLETKLGVGLNNVYIGANVEKTLFSNTIAGSIAGGAHIQSDVGLDGTLNLTLPLGGVNFYTGLDADIIFGDEVTVPIWMFFGGEVGIRKNYSLFFEIDGGLSKDASGIFCLGFNFYI